MAGCLERIFACCFGGAQGGTGDADESDAPYQRLDQDDVPNGNVRTVRPRITDHRNFRESANDLAHASSLNSGDSPNGDQRVPLSKKEAAEAELNRIISKTQDNIIDVSHLDNVEAPSGELVERQRRYEEAVKNHDARIGRTNGNGNGHKSPVGSSGLSRQLLEDCGSRVPDWLARPLIAKARLRSVQSASNSMSDVVKESIKITPKGKLVVFMDK